MPDALRILVVEDHRTVREGLRLIIEAQPEMTVVGEANNGREALELARELAPDVVLMDVSMPELNGLLATAELKRVRPEVKVIALTRHADEAYVHEMLQAGVAGYVLKQSAASELIRAIRAVAAGASYLDPAVTETVVHSFAERKNKLRGETAGAPLTERETEVLRRIARGYSNKEIAAEFDLSIKTIEAHKASALRKLNITTRKEIIDYAILQGWMQES